MSRHRKQRIKRFNKTLAKVDPGDLSYGLRVWEERGKLTRHVDATTRLAVLREIKKEKRHA